MKIISLSDLHGLLPVKIDECDVICIAGDIVPVKMQRNMAQTASWFKKTFLPWAEALPCKKVLFIAGNHDFWMETERWIALHSGVPTVKTVLNQFGSDKIVYLQDSGVEIDGYKFWGSPWITGLPGWAFNCDTDEAQRAIFENIPKDTDVLITHTPPFGDVGTVHQACRVHGFNFGSTALRQVLEEDDCKIRFSMSGHVHTGLHDGEIIGNTVCYNVSILNEDYVESFPYKIIEI